MICLFLKKLSLGNFRAIAFPQHDATWTSGPSLPRDRPAPTASGKLIALPISRDPTGSTSRKSLKMVKNLFQEKRLPWPWSVSGVRIRPRWVQKTQKKNNFFSKFWVIRPQILKILTNFRFCSEKLSSHPWSSLDKVFL